MPATGVAARRLTSSLFSRGGFLAGILAALWAASLIPLVSVGASSERLVEAFATDEAMQLNLLHAAAAKHSFALTFGPYGHLVFNLILLALHAIPGALSDARIIHTGRSISVLFAAATLYLTFVWARRAFGAAAAWIAFSVLLVNATLYTWAVVLKPDMVQLFLLMLSLALTSRLAEEPRIRWLALASAAAGLAFACKYSGLFVLPIIGAVVVWRPVEGGPAARVTLLRWLTAALAIVLLAGSFLLNVAWIASHLTEDGHIDAGVSPFALTLLSTAAREERRHRDRQAPEEQQSKGGKEPQPQQQRPRGRHLRISPRALRGSDTRKRQQQPPQQQSNPHRSTSLRCHQVQHRGCQIGTPNGRGRSSDDTMEGTGGAE